MLSPEQRRLRQHAKEIFLAGIEAVDPGKAVLRALQFDNGRLRVAGRGFDLRQFDRVLLVGAGKASAAMARGVESCMGERVSHGIVATKDGYGLELDRVRVLEAGHPIPDARGERAAKQMLQLAESAGERDLIICVISGGGSALLPLPAPNLKLEEEQMVTSLLLSHGVTIHETNTVRKHLSLIKGGQLARAAYPATVITLILSDVVGDPIDIIASGPTVPDSSTFADAERILVLYGIWPKLPDRVRRHITLGCNGRAPETPKPGDVIFDRTHSCIVGSITDALSAGERHAHSLGYRSMILANRVQGEARDIGRFYAAIMQNLVDRMEPIRPPACLLAGGETTVTVRNPGGKGGRNQEMALSVALDIDGLPRCLFLSAGTDGTDGPTEVAGAFADGMSVARARTHGLQFLTSFLRDNDSYTFFQKIGDHFVTGPTRTNVMDLQIILVEG